MVINSGIRDSSAPALDIDVSTNAQIIVSGSPRIAVELDWSSTSSNVLRYASYVSAESTSSSMKFPYTIQNGDVDINGIKLPNSTIDLNGGTIQTIDGFSHPLTLPTSSIPLANANGILVDGIGTAYSIPLDTVPGARAAYSLRRTRSGYSGAAVRLRRASDNSLWNIGFTPWGHLNQSQMAVILGSSNGFVETWYDQSGNGLNAANATTSQQPQLASAGVLIEEWR